jgi:transcriptional regulator with XRE-family HTH domain
MATDRTAPETIPVARSPENAALGNRFREVRRRQKVGLLALSKALGCSLNTVRWHEAGARMLRLDHVVQAAGIMGVQPAELLPGRDEEPRP